MTVPFHVEEKRQQTLSSALSAVALSLPILGCLIAAYVAFVAFTAILTRSSNRIKDTATLIAFVVCYAVATFISAYLFSKFWSDYILLYGVPVFPVSFYFLRRISRVID